MKALNIASTLTSINELYINEAAEMPYEATVIPAEKRKNAFIRFLNSGWGVAMLCALVAITVTVGIIAAGQAAGPVTTLPGAGPTHPTFAFDYEIEPEQDMFQPGDTLTVHTEVKNLGIPFTVKGSSQKFSAEAWLVPHGAKDVYDQVNRINGLFAYTEDYVVQTIDQGAVGKHSGLITIPQDAAVGTYDLVLAYKGEYQIFEKAITVAAKSWVSTDIEFSITRFPDSKEYAPGQTVTFDFKIKGIDHVWASDVGTDVPIQKPYTVSAIFTPHGKSTDDASAIVGRVEWDIEANAAVSSMTWEYYTASFIIPESAEDGAYGLCLRYVSTKEGDDTVKEKWSSEFITVTDSHPNFDFTYDFSPSEDSFAIGDTFQIETHIWNMGEAFTVTGNSLTFSAEAKLVHHDNPEKVIYAHFSYPEDEVTQEIPPKMRGHHTGYFTIPANAVTGYYDVWLYYGDEYEVFESVVLIVEDTNPTFEFSYTIDPDSTSFVPGDSLDIHTVTVNLGESFVFEGSLSNDYGASTMLVPHGTSPDGEHVIDDVYAEADDISTMTVTGGMAIERKSTLYIPPNAALGWYDLYLSFQGEYIVVEKAIYVKPADADTFMILTPNNGDIGTSQDIISAYSTSADTLGLGLTSSTGGIFTDETLIGTQKATPFGTLTYNHSQTTTCSDGNGGYLTLDFYQNGQDRVGYLRGTDTISSYNFSDIEKAPDLNVPLTEAEAEVMARDLLSQILSSEITATFGEPKVFRHTKSGEDRITFTYAYRINGYDTSEQYNVSIYLAKGIMDNYSYISRSSLSTPASFPSADDLKEAENAIIEKLSSMDIEGLSLQNLCGVALNNDGEFYMVVGFTATYNSFISINGEEYTSTRTYYMLMKVT